MRIKYFPDTGTVLIEFSTYPIAETKEINEDIYVDLDSEGKPVAITIEHADLYANLPNLFYEQITASEPQSLWI